MIAQLHLLLAWASVVVVIALVARAAWRALRGQPVGPAGDQLESVVLIVVLITIAGGLGLFVSGPGPKEGLHFLYGALAFGILPVARSISQRWDARRQSITIAIAALVVLVVLVRLFSTG
jgi:hypothetical protein